MEVSLAWPSRGQRLARSQAAHPAPGQGQSIRRAWAKLWSCPKSAACTTATNAARPDRRKPLPRRRRHGWPTSAHSTRKPPLRCRSRARRGRARARARFRPHLLPRIGHPTVPDDELAKDRPGHELGEEPAHMDPRLGLRSERSCMGKPISRSGLPTLRVLQPSCRPRSADFRRWLGLAVPRQQGIRALT